MLFPHRLLVEARFSVYFSLTWLSKKCCHTGVQVMTKAQTSHPLDPLSAAEISVAVATVRAAGATPEVAD